MGICLLKVCCLEVVCRRVSERWWEMLNSKFKCMLLDSCPWLYHQELVEITSAGNMLQDWLTDWFIFENTVNLLYIVYILDQFGGPPWWYIHKSIITDGNSWRPRYIGRKSVISRVFRLCTMEITDATAITDENSDTADENPL